VETALPCPTSTAPRGRGLFVVGTDTDVGKTAVAVAILRGLVAAGCRAAAYKPVASGLGAVDSAGGDPIRLWEAAGRTGTVAAVCPQCFPAPLAPPRAARAAGRPIDETLLRSGLAVWNDHDLVVVEGAGGLFSPLGPMTLGVDLAVEFGYPLVVVDSARLGAIGRTLATVRAARAGGLAVAACVLSEVTAPRGSAFDPGSEAAIVAANVADLGLLLRDIPVLRLPHGAADFDPPADWLALAGDRSARAGLRHPAAGSPPPRPAAG